MKKFLLFLIIDFVLYAARTQAATLTFYPFGAQGEECSIWTLSPNTNRGAYDHIAINGWTWNGSPGIEREVMNFNWSLIPPNATITCAFLSLYGNVVDTVQPLQDDWPLSGSNAFVIQRVTSAWNASTVTWNSQPNTDTVHHVSLPPSTGQFDNYLNIDVLAMVQDLYNNQGSYFGFLFLLQNENYYRRMCFESCEQPDTTLFPKLVVCYTLNGNPPRTYFQSSGTEFCGEGGACVNFFDSSSGNPTSWQWIFNHAVPDSSNRQNPDSICFYQPGTYPVTLITGNAYGYDTLTVPSMIILEQLPVAPVVTVVGGDTLICSYASHYQWFFNGSPIFGATDSFYVAKTAGTYAVQVGDIIGCSRISNGVLISGLAPDPSPNEREVEILPNPFHDTFTIYTSDLMVNAILGIYNPLGIGVYEEKFTGKQWTIHCKLPPGIYFVQIQCEKGIFAKKDIIEQ